MKFLLFSCLFSHPNLTQPYKWHGALGKLELSNVTLVPSKAQTSPMLIRLFLFTTFAFNHLTDLFFVYNSIPFVFGGLAAAWNDSGCEGNYVTFFIFSRSSRRKEEKEVQKLFSVLGCEGIRKLGQIFKAFVTSFFAMAHDLCRILISKSIFQIKLVTLPPHSSCYMNTSISHTIKL